MNDKTFKRTEITQSIDTCGTRCPIPLLRAKQALKTMHKGELLEVLATDPSARGDFQAMLKHLPHELLDCTRRQEAEVYIDSFIIRKG